MIFLAMKVTVLLLSFHHSVLSLASGPFASGMSLKLCCFRFFLILLADSFALNLSDFQFNVSNSIEFDTLETDSASLSDDAPPYHNLLIKPQSQNLRINRGSKSHKMSYIIIASSDNAEIKKNIYLFIITSFQKFWSTFLT